MPTHVKRFLATGHDQTVAEERLTMQVTSFFGIVALLLAALGLHRGDAGFLHAAVAHAGFPHVPNDAAARLVK